MSKEAIQCRWVWLLARSPKLQQIILVPQFFLLLEQNPQATKKEYVINRLLFNLFKNVCYQYTVINQLILLLVKINKKIAQK